MCLIYLANVRRSSEGRSSRPKTTKDPSMVLTVEILVVRTRNIDSRSEGRHFTKKSLGTETNDRFGPTL